MSDEQQVPDQQAEVQPLVNPAVSKTHILTMGSADVAFKTDMSAKAGLTYGKLLTLPVAEVIRIYGLT